jgi:hypothetical protein
MPKLALFDFRRVVGKCFDSQIKTKIQEQILISFSCQFQKAKQEIAMLFTMNSRKFLQCFP